VSSTPQSQVIASKAKQSISRRNDRMDCFVAFAPRNDGSFKYNSAFSRHAAPELFKSFRPKEIRGRRECRVRAAPTVSCAKDALYKTHTSIQVQRKQSDIPRAMVLRLIPRSPRRRIRLVTVADGLAVRIVRLDYSNLRQLDTSNGCQDHTVLPYASASFVCASRRSLTGEPALQLRSRPTLPRPPHPVPTFVTMANAPCSGTGWASL
jgi:hypothetical protein